MMITRIQRKKLHKVSTNLIFSKICLGAQESYCMLNHILKAKEQENVSQPLCWKILFLIAVFGVFFFTTKLAY